MLLLFVFINSLFLQHDSITCNNNFFEVGKMGNIYAVNGMQLKKIDATGAILFSYSNGSFGDISTIDISNPLQILVYYNDFNQVVYLDKYLAPIGSAIDLYEYSESDTNVVCASQKGGFWIYNNINNQAIRVNSNGDIATKSMLLSGFFAPSEITKITEYNNQLYLLYADKGVVVLNQNGQFLQQIIIPDIRCLQLYKQQLYYTTNQGLYRYSFNNKPLQVWQGNAQQITISNNKIFYSNGKTIQSIKASEL